MLIIAERRTTCNGGYKVILLASFSDLVIMYDPLSESLVQHLSVPLLKPLGLGDLLVRRVAVENVVVSFAGWAGPNVARHIPDEELSYDPLSTCKKLNIYRCINI